MDAGPGTGCTNLCTNAEEGLDEVFSSEPYRRFLRFVANNPTYSYRNALLILHQKPNATKVMGFKAWLRQDRCVQ